MEYLRGGTLHEAAKAHKFNDKHIAYVAHEVLMALKFLHAKNFVHRDLKSQNVMMDVTGKIKIIDFGLCADFSDGQRISMVGSPFWIPPEMIRDEPHSFPCDVWSMAVCLMELYLGTPPHPISGIKCMFLAATTGLADQIPSSATPLATAFLKRCLEVNQYERATPDSLLQDPWVRQPNLAGGIDKVLRDIFLVGSLEQIGI